MKFNEIVSSTATKKQRIELKSQTWIQHQIKQQADRFEGSSFGKFAAGIKQWLKFERLIAITFLLFPLLLIVIDGWPTEGKDSISAYYVMNDQKNLWAFYFPLTIAAMMLIVNGLIKNKAWYNIYLGVMLSGVILFNHVDFGIIHSIFALFFFVGNVIVIKFAKTGFFQKPKEELFFDLALITIIVLSLVLFFSHVINTFYLEWISFVIISFHFILLSIGTAPDVRPRRTGRTRVNP